MEIQALEAIYGDDFKRLDDGAGPAKFEVTLVPVAGAGDDVNHVSVAVCITYTPTYPEAAPELSLRAVRRGGLTDELVSECEQLLRGAASSEELLGTAMIYAIAEKAQEWLVEHNKPELDMHAEMMARLAAQDQRNAPSASDDHDDHSEDAVAAVLERRKKGGGVGASGEGSWSFLALAGAGARP